MDAAKMPRSVLVNTVLDGSITHLMAAMSFTQGALDILDKKRRSFLWTGADKTSGAQCLVAWPKVCTSKTQGGLGVRDLALQGQCLQLKLLHRLYNSTDSAWAVWFREGIDLCTLKGPLAEGPHWESLRALLPFYRNISRVILGDGLNTNFWEDIWCGDSPLSDQYPHLFSHVCRPSVSVSVALQTNLEGVFVPRLTTLATTELVSLKIKLEQATLRDCPDRRSCSFASPDGVLRAGPVYKAIKSNEQKQPFFEFVWQNCAPPKSSVLCMVSSTRKSQV